MADHKNDHSLPKGFLRCGDTAPLKVIVEDIHGNHVSLADMLGKFIVLYFYPKDNTPGCIKEACSFRDWNDEFKAMGAEVIGVSKDLADSHEKFIEKFKLNFTLWVDAEHTLMDAFGSWQMKKFMGREYMGAVRSTFLIDPKGVIIAAWERVTPDDHGKEVYDALKALKKK